MVRMLYLSIFILALQQQQKNIINISGQRVGVSGGGGYGANGYEGCGGGYEVYDVMDLQNHQVKYVYIFCK